MGTMATLESSKPHGSHGINSSDGDVAFRRKRHTEGTKAEKW